MAATTPSGWRRIWLLSPAMYSAVALPSRWRAAPAKNRRLSTVSGRSNAVENFSGLPVLRDSVRAKRSARSSSRPARRSSTAARSAGGRPARAIFSSASSPIRAGGRRVCSCIGAATLSLTVREENSAPCWNSTPQRRSMAARSVLEPCGFMPNTLTSPESGGRRPMMVFSSTVLPVPEPPTTPSTSPLLTLRSRPSWIRWSPNRLCSRRTTMGGASSARSSGGA